MNDFAAWVCLVVVAVALLAALLLAIPSPDFDEYITLDCRDGQHRACAACSCACHLIEWDDNYSTLQSMAAWEAVHADWTPNPENRSQ